jgi:hypothetical protein
MDTLLEPTPPHENDLTSVITDVSRNRVPVSTTEARLAKREIGVPALVGANPKHMSRLVGVLVHTYGWVLGQDGNLYAPDSSLAWGERVA